MSVDNFKAGLQKVKEYVDGKVPTLPTTVAKTDVENTFTATQTFGDVKTSGVYGMGSKLLLVEYENGAALGVSGAVRPKVAQVTDSGTTYKELLLKDDISTNANVIYFPPFDNTASQKRHGLLIGSFTFGSGERERNIDYTQYIDASKWFGTTALICSLSQPGSTDYKPVVYGQWIATSVGNFLKFALSEAVPQGQTISCRYAYFFLENVT